MRLAQPPASLSLRPTLEAVVEGGKRGRTEAELSYLTGGLSWNAEHVLVRGREYRAASRQELLIQRYRTLPPGHTAP